MGILRQSRIGFALLGGVITTLATVPPAAATIILEDPGSIVVQQVNDHPCLFGGNSCNNPTGFDYTLLSNNPAGDTYNTDSPTYTVGQIRSILALTDPTNFNSFFVGIDLNTTGKPTEALQLFSITVGGVLIDSFSATAPGQLLQTENNGTGFSDDLLKGFDLSSFAATDSVVFHLTENGAVDGAEEYFLINAANPEPVPEPASLALFGSGVIAMMGALVLQRRRKRDSTVA